MLSIDVLFVPFDAGEALAFEPVLPMLEEAGLTYRVLALATARTLYRSHPYYLGLHRDMGAHVDIGPMNWPHLESLPEDELRVVLAEIQPRLVIVGMVSEVQRQFAEGFGSNGVRVIGYFDAVHRYQDTIMEARVLPSVHEVWVPADRVAETLPNVPVQVVGQPSLSTWISRVDTSDLESYLATLPKRPRTVLYCSGYGDDFVPSFELFIRVVAGFDDVNVVVSLHPRVPGDQERQLLDASPAENIYIAPRKFSSSLIAHCVDVVVCYRSTAGFQALFLDKPVIYALSGTVPFSNLPIDLGLVPMVCTEQDLDRALRAALDLDEHPSSEEVRTRLGLPEDSVEAFFTQLQQQL